MGTANHTTNYNLSQYGANDPVKYLTNYNQDMAAIDTAIKAALDSANAKTPLTRTIAGLPLSGDITLAQLIAAGLCAAPESGIWTPIIYGSTTAGAPTYTSRGGSFTKIGNLYLLKFSLLVSAKGGMAGGTRIGGLPASASYGMLYLTNTTGFTLPSGDALMPCPVTTNYADLQFASNTIVSNIDVSAIADNFSIYYGSGFMVV